MTSLSEPPTDSISRVVFSPKKNDPSLLVSSWDSTLSLYNTGTGDRSWSIPSSHALLDCCYVQEHSSCVSAGLSKIITMHNLETKQATAIGNHDAAIRRLSYSTETQLLFSGGWDRRLKGWDLRAGHLAHDFEVPGKVFAMDTSEHHLVVADSNKITSIFDLRNLGKHPITRSNCLKYQHRDLACFPDGAGFAIASTEGRVAWEYITDDPNDKFAFRCHRIKNESGTELIYPVNALAFHPVHGTFATGGGDGAVSVWDGYHKKRLWRNTKSFDTAVTSLAFSTDGVSLAIAVSYDFAQGDVEGVAPPQIILRGMRDEDVMPKPQKSAA